MIKIKDDAVFDVKTRDLLKELSLKNQTIGLDINVPDFFYQKLLEQLLERDYLNDTGEKTFLYDKKMRKSKINWMQITRLPIHPNENESYDLLSRWQGVLSSLHAWNYRLLFALIRNEGQTKLYLGTTSAKQEISPDEALEQVREATFGSMPGMELEILTKEQRVDEITVPLQNMNCIGAVTGIPSLRDSEQSSIMQTLDSLAFGIRDAMGNEKNYAMIVIADPICDREISDIISRYRQMGSKIHTAAKITGTQSLSRGESKDNAVGIQSGIAILGTVLGAIAGSFVGDIYQGTIIGGQLAGGLRRSRQGNVSGSASVNMEYLDKFAQYAEEVTEHHVGRLLEGRNLGFWNAGIYVLGEMPRDVITVTGMLRSIYSGDQTSFEPIRLHLFNNNSNALEIVRNNFELLPMVDVDVIKEKDKYDYSDDRWHILGKRYQYVSTPLNTRELSIATSLPRRDVPGLRFVKTAVRFANNPAPVKGSSISLGHIVDTGIEQSTTYNIDVNSLVRHTLISGSTGSGKSTTCKRILTEVLRGDIPVMVIEPAKDDYVRWAIDMNKHLPKEKQFKIYMPGVEDFDGYKVNDLKINLYEPATKRGEKVDILQHSETAATLLNACLPADEVVPILIEEVVYETIKEFTIRNNIDLETGASDPLSDYPDIDCLLVKAGEVMRKKSYADINKDNLTEVLVTRFKSLRRGMRGKILNVTKSVDYEGLFSGNVIINISRLAGSKDKALVMSLLLQALYEYRISRYASDDVYRKRAQKNELLHLMLIEEAHNVFIKPDVNKSGDSQRAAADLFGNMLSEVRGYGQGFVVVDQVPTRLIDDAIKNTNYKIVHRLTAPDDQEVMASCMALRKDQQYIIPALERGNVVVCGDEDDAAAWVKVSVK